MIHRSTTTALLLAGVMMGAGLAGCQPQNTNQRNAAGGGDSTAKSSRPDATTDQQGTLYERLGKESGIRMVVDDFVERALADENVNFTRKGTEAEWKPSAGDVVRFKELLVEFIANAAGGPHEYTGRSMAESHEGMQITDEEFDALAGHLVAALEEAGVSVEDQNALTAKVETTRGDIVGR